MSDISSTPILIDTINSSTSFTTSQWADQYMFFQHHFIEDDYNIKSAWRTAVWLWTTVDLEFYMKKYHMRREQLEEYMKRMHPGTELRIIE